MNNYKNICEDMAAKLLRKMATNMAAKKGELKESLSWQVFLQFLYKHRTKKIPPKYIRINSKQMNRC